MLTIRTVSPRTMMGGDLATLCQKASRRRDDARNSSKTRLLVFCRDDSIDIVDVALHPNVCVIRCSVCILQDLLFILLGRIHTLNGRLALPDLLSSKSCQLLLSSYLLLSLGCGGLSDRLLLSGCPLLRCLSCEKARISRCSSLAGHEGRLILDVCRRILVESCLSSIGTGSSNDPLN